MRRVGWLDNPHIALRLSLLQLVVVGLELVELIRQHVGVGDKVELRAAELFLHLQVVVAQAVLASDFVTLREVIDLLILVETLILVALA